MFAIAILFGLGVWVLITIIAIVIGAKLAGGKGAFAGFMLTMGGFIVYWIGEYMYIQHTVSHLCESEGGITVYVTPEKWREQIGEEEWEKLIPYTKEKVLNSNEIGKEFILDNIKFEHSEGNTHLKGGVLENDKIALYTTYTAPKPIYGSKSISLITEKDTKEVLLKEVSFFYNSGGLDLKFWLNNIQSCNHTKEFVQIAHKYSNIENIGVTNE